MDVITQEYKHPDALQSIVDTDSIQTREEYNAVIDWLAVHSGNSEMKHVALRLCIRVSQKLTPVRKALLDQDVDWLIAHAENTDMWRVAWRLSQTIRTNKWSFR